MKAFTSKFPLDTIENFMDRYDKTLGTFRDHTALMTYAGRLGGLPSTEQGPLFEKLTEYVQSVLNGTFSVDRYTGNHLDTVFKSKPNLEAEWKKGDTTELKLVETEDITQQSVNYGALIARSIDEGHIDKNKVNFVERFLKNRTSSATEKKQLSEEEGLLLTQMNDKNTTQEEKNHLIFQRNIIQIAKAKSKEDALQRLELCLKNFPSELNNTQFKSDLEGWKKSLAEKSLASKKTDGWTLQDSDDPCDLLLCGTEVEGSCQHVNNDPQFNKCLLAYLLDGKNRILAIKDKDGVIKARSVLRLLWDGQQPVLFLERTYPGILDPQLREKLLDFAKLRAKALDLPLVSRECGAGQSYGKDIHSLGGRAPFEYVDASGGVNKDSIWSINGAHVIL